MNVLAAAVPFGLGPAGKLATLVEAAPWINWFACGDRFDESIFEGDPFSGQLWSRDRNELREFAKSCQIDRALIVLDPPLALLIEELGIPVVYVDSLPFLWTDGDAIPSSVTAYCAQLCMYLPQSSWRQLRAVENLVWTKGIVPRGLQPSPEKTRRGQFVVNFGGLSSPHGRGVAYAQTILPPLVGAIGETNCRRLLVTSSKAGAIALKMVWDEIKDSLDPTVEPEFATLPKKEFLKEAGLSEILVTSPGLTTLLETAALKIPTVLLPPQNLSQYINCRMHQMASTNGEAVLWPTKGLSFESLESFLDDGEEAVVSRIYQEIGDLAGKPEISESLEAVFRSCLHRARTGRNATGTILDRIGCDGSAEILGVLNSL